MVRTTDPKKPCLDPGLTERLACEEAQLDRCRPLPSETVRRLNEERKIVLTPSFIQQRTSRCIARLQLGLSKDVIDNTAESLNHVQPCFLT
jgi:hypothetical protein